MGQNYGNIEASFYSDSIQGINIAAGASIYMGMGNEIDNPLNLSKKIDRQKADRPH